MRGLWGSVRQPGPRHRIGDLRRYEKRGVGDFWPSGQHPNAIWGNYEDGKCIPVPLAEKIGNPNLEG